MKARISVLGVVSLLTACLSDNLSDLDVKVDSPALKAGRVYWEEQLDSNAVYFEGTTSEFQFFGDSVEIVQRSWTDAAECLTDSNGITSCSPWEWNHSFLGISNRNDSTLSLTVQHHHSFPSNAPRPATTSYDAVFGLRFSEDSTRMEIRLNTGSRFLGTDSITVFQKLGHQDVNILSAEIRNDCGPADGRETRLTFLPDACPTCTSGSKAPFTLSLAPHDVDSIQSGDTYYGEAWRCGNDGCADSAYATIEVSQAKGDSVSGTITLRKGNIRSQGSFTAPKKRQRPMCG